jgi:hypothetical protein
MSVARDDLAALSNLPIAKLRARWRRLAGSEPPAAMSRDLLLREVAYKLQVMTHGGLSQALRRRLRSIARGMEEGMSGGDSAISLKPGVRLVREWGGRSHHVVVLDDGFSYEGNRYRSLTEVAQTITGARWSGPRFFGLRRRTGKRFVPVDAEHE